MAESYLANADLADLDGTVDASGLPHATYGLASWVYYLYKLVHRSALVAGPLGCRVYKDDAGALKYGVKAGLVWGGMAAVAYAGASNQALTNDATNYIYLTTAGTLTINTTGFPVTPHIPLATIATGTASAAAVTGAYAIGDITDYRGRSVIQPVGIGTLVAAAEGADARVITFQGAAGRHRVRIWVGTSAYGAPSATDNTVAVSTGTQLREITANADYEIITDAAGAAAITVTITGAATRHVMAEVDGAIVTSGEVAWAA